MVGKNNKQIKNTKQGTKVETYGIKKFKVGAASVVIGASIFFGAGVAAASEEVANNTTDANTTNAKEEGLVAESEAPKAVAAPKTEVKQAIKEEVAKAVATKVVDKNTLKTNVEKLEAAIKEADTTKVPASTLEKAKAELETAKAVLVNEKATQEEVDAAAKSASSQNFVISSMPKAGEVKKEVTEGANTIANSGKNDPRNGKSMGEGVAPKAATGVDTTSLQSTVETLEKLLNSGNLEAVDAKLKTESQTELAKGKAMLTDTTSTAQEVAAMVKKLQDLGHKMTLQIPLSGKSKQEIDKLEVGQGVGVLVEETSPATPAMTDPNGASLKNQEAPSYEGVKLQPTSVEGRSTFAYGGLYYLQFPGIDVTTPKLAPTYYVRGSRSKDVKDDSILVEVVKIQDNSVVETHTLQPGGTAKSTILAIDDRIPPHYNMPGDNYVHFQYDNSTKSETSLGKLGYYLSHPGSAWSMGTYEIPAEANYITKYMTTDGKELATYTMKGWSDQIATPSEKREFDEYTYIETLIKGTPELNIDEIDSIERLAQLYNTKLLRRVVKEDGTVIKTLYIKDPTLTNAQVASTAGSDTKGYIKVFETSEIAPWDTNKNLKFFFGNDTLMSNGQPLITEEVAKEIEKLANENPSDPTKNTVRIYINPDDVNKPDANQHSIEIGFVGANDAVRPYGISIGNGGKSLYIRNRTATYVNSEGVTVSGPNNFRLIPLYNEMLYTPEVVHLYEPAVSVKVKYVDEDGKELIGTGKGYKDNPTAEKQLSAGGVVDTPKQSLVEVNQNTPAYDTTDNRPNYIVASDGTVYKYVAVKEGSIPETGQLTMGEHVVSYVYEEVKGNVVIKYENMQGEEIAADQKDVDNQVITDPAKTYDATENDNTKQERPEKIETKDGIVYYFEATSADVTKSYYDNNTPNDKTDDKVAAPIGNVQLGTTTVTHVYDKAGSVVINYINTDGTVIKTEVADQAADDIAVTNVKKDTAYNAADKDQKPTEIKDGDKIYRLVTQAGNTRGTTVFKYDANGVVTSTNTNSTDLGNNRVIAGAEGKVEAGKTKVVTYVYDEVLGKVAVKYIATDGTVLDGDVTLNDDTATTNIPTTGVEVEFGVGALASTETSGGTAYNTADKRPEKITKDGKVYYKVLATGTTTSNVNYVDGVATGAGHAAESGKVVADATQTVTYVYKEVKGNVVVKYETTDGTQLSGNLLVDNKAANIDPAGVPVAGATDVSGGTAYNTATLNKPTTITTADGKVYKLVAKAEAGKYAANGVKDGSAPENGEEAKVVGGETLTVTYVYEEVKGNVVIEYYDTDDNKIADNKETPKQSIDAAYNTNNPTDKPETITKDGVKYFYKEVRKDSASEEGKISETPKVIKYVYEKAGAVTVNYIATDGTVIKTPQEAVKDGKPESNYDVTTSTLKPQTISFGGKTYRLVAKEGTTTDASKVEYNKDGVATGDLQGNAYAPENGEKAKVVAGQTQNVTYVYEEVKGEVFVKYETTDGVAIDGQLTADGKEITVPTTGIMDTPQGGDSVGANYETLDHKPKVIVKDGKTYRLVAKEEAGKYSANGVKVGSAEERGTVKETPQTVTYVYEEVKYGTVIVKYEDVNGNEIASKVKVKDNEEVDEGKTYDTTGDKLAVIKKDNKLYQLVTKEEAGKYSANGVKVGSDAEKAALTEGTKTITYVYEEITPEANKGTVIVHYVDESGKPVDNTMIAVNNKPVDEEYTTTPKNIPGYTFVKVADTSATPSGKVKEGITEVTYVYKEAKGSVVVKYVDEKGNPISGTTTGIVKPSVATTEKDVDAQGNEVTNVEVGTKYDTTDLRPQTITTADGKVYELVVEKIPANEKGEVVEGETVVTYVYKEKVSTEQTGSVVVKYVDENGRELIADRIDTKPSPVGTKYKTNEPGENPRTITKDGKKYELVRIVGTEEGLVTPGVTTVTYVYREVKQTPTTDVVTTYEDENGNVLSPREAGTKAPKQIAGYEFVRTVVDPNGNTRHIYKKVVTPTSSVTTIWITEDGEVLRDLTKGSLEPGAFPGYEYVRTEVDAKGNRTHIFRKLTSTSMMKEKQLPNTSANNTANNNANVAGLGLIGMIAAAIATRRRKKDNE